MSGSSREVSWSATDTLLYALAVGAGQDDPLRDLSLTTDNSEGVSQDVLPTFASVLAQRVGRPPIGDLDRRSMLHVGESVDLHAPLPAAGRAHGRARVCGIYDAGANAIAVVETVLLDADSGEPLATTSSTLFARGARGLDGQRPADEPWEPGDGEPDHRLAYSIAPNQALLYRLCGDRNPLHSDPARARQAGFERPPIHGLCTHGFVARALVATACAGEVGYFGSLGGRFTAPVFPGERLDVAIWERDGGALVQARTARGVVLDRGRFHVGAGVAVGR
jgi:acyl dehydratase